MGEKDKSDVGDIPREKRIDVSPAQVAGSALAAVIAAVLAGRMGVYGTFIGAGVISVVATTGGPVFQHFFRRTGEQIKEKKDQVPPRVRNAAVRRRGPADATVTAAATTASAGTEDEDRTRLLPRSGQAASAEATQLMPVTDSTAVLSSAEASDSHGEVTETGGEVSADGEEGPADGHDLSGDEFSDSSVHGTRWRGWKRTLLPAALVFVLAVGGITVFELVSGSNVSGGKGTSIGNAVSPGGSSPSSDEPPATTPSQEGAPSEEPPSAGDDEGTGSTGEQPAEPGTGSSGTESGGTGTEDGGGPATGPAPTSPGTDGSGTDSGGPDSGTGSDGADSGATEGSTGSSSGSGEDGSGTGEQPPESGSGQEGVTGSGELHPQPQQTLPGSG